MLTATYDNPYGITLIHERTELVQTILTYCMKNPDAKDTLEGIRQWWLPPAMGDRGFEEIQRVLDALVVLGWLSKRNVFQSAAIYGLNRAASDAVTNFLSVEHSNRPDHSIEQHDEVGLIKPKTPAGKVTQGE